jgi:hypothetical protein
MLCIQDLKLLEKALLQNYVNYTDRSKIFEYTLTKQLSSGQIRVYQDISKINGKRNKYVIKISGIWETSEKIGITYKILEL